MKIEHISIQNFKKFEKLEVSFKNKTLEEVSDRFLLLGDNGSGKTTLLQAIALPLALATGKIQSIANFKWIGFLPGRYWKWGTPRIELEVSFEEEEIEATRDIARKWYDAQPPEFRSYQDFIEPGGSRIVRVILSGDYWEAGDSPGKRAQFRGRYYAQWFINKNEQSVRSYFPKLPGIFWFDQFRNLGSNPAPDGTGDGFKERSSSVSFESGVGYLRRFLIDWRRKQESGSRNYPVDYLNQLETLYKKVFPDRSFWGLENLPSFDSPTEESTYFLLNDGNRRYDIEEMSAGEQAVFPILYEFVRQQIAYSVVLIDEIDLNLHPSAAQFLVSQLPKIAPTCQFILTTHSRSVSDVIGETETHRLAGGVLCL